MGAVVLNTWRRVLPLLSVALLVSACAGTPAGQRTTAVEPRDLLLMASTIGPIDKEMELWQKAGVKPAGAWNVTYEKGASGNAPTTRYANERGAYLLMDRATYFTLTKEIGLQVLVERDADLLNYIAVIRMNPAKFPKANAAGAQTFVDWLVSDEAQRLIKSFGVDQLSRQLKKAHLLRWRARAMLWRTERARLAPPIACRLAFGPF